MKNIKLILISILRFFGLNVASLIGFMLLVFFSITIFTALNSISTSLNNSLTSITKKGNLHDFVINENYNVGNSNFDVQAKQETPSGSQNSFNYSYSFTINRELWSSGHKITYDHFLGWINSADQESYDQYFKGNEKLFFYFKNPTNQDFSKVDVVESNSSYASELGLPATIVGTDLDDAINKAKNNLNIFLTAPLNNLVSNVIPVIYKDEILIKTNNNIKIRDFNALDVSTNKQNIYYKIIESNPDYEIDNIVIFDGNNLPVEKKFSSFINDLINEYKNKGENYFNNLKPNIAIDPSYEGDDFINDDIRLLTATWKYIDLFLKADWSNTFTLNDITMSNMVVIIDESKMYQKLNPWNFTDAELSSALGNHNSEKNQRDFKTLFLEMGYFIEQRNNYVLIPTPFNVTFNKTTSIIPSLGTITNKNSYEAVLTPSFFDQTFSYFDENENSWNDYKKKPIDISEWNRAKDQNEVIFKEWLNELPNENKVEVDNEIFVLLGSGLSPDFIYPVVNQGRPIPDPKKEQIIYLSNSGYSKMYNNFRGSPVENFIVGKNLDGNNYIDIINEISKEFMLWPTGTNAAYLNNDLSNTLTPASQRVVFVPQMTNTIGVISLFLTTFIIILTLIVIAIMIKRFVEINKTDLAILLANGFSKWELVLSLSFMILIFSGIAVVAGVIAGIALQIPGLLLFSKFLTMPVATIELSWGFLFSVLGVSSLVFGLIALIFSFTSLRGNVVDLMKKDTNYVLNKLSKIVKKSFGKRSILTLFRLSLVFSTPWKVFSLSLISSIAVSSLAFGISTLNKFQIAEKHTFESKKYANAIDLYSPTNVGGLYYSTPMNKTTTTLFDGLYSFNEEINMRRYNEFVWDEKNNGSIKLPNSNEKQKIDVITQNYIYQKANGILHNNYTKKDVSRDALVDNNILLGGNLHLPSMQDTNWSVSDPSYMEYKTSSKLSLEHKIVFVVPWQIAEKLMPTNTARYFNDNYELLLEQLYRSDELLLVQDGNNWINKTYAEAVNPFITKTRETDAIASGRSIFKLTYIDDNDEIKQYRISSSNQLIEDDPDDQDNQLLPKAFAFIDKSIDPNPLRFNLREDFINIIYGIENSKTLFPYNYSMNYKKFPIGENDETYTSVQFEIIKKNGQKTSSNPIVGRGIKDDSQYVALLDNGVNIANKIEGEVSSLWNEINSDKPDDSKNFEPYLIPTIASKFAQKTFNLNVGDVLTINVLNDTMRFEDKYANKAEKPYSLQIVGINDSYKDNEFYFSHENANLLTNIKTLQKPLISFSDSMQKILDQEDNQKWLYGFNGIFTSNEEIPQAIQTISLYSPYNLYFGFDKITSPEFLVAMKKTKDGDDPKTKEETNFYNAIMKTKTQDYFQNYLNPENTNIIPTDEMIDNLVQIIVETYKGDSFFVSLLANVEPTSILRNVFSNISDLTLNLQIISVSIIAVSSFIIVILITLITISDSMRLAGILKALGLRSRTNALSFLMMYFPIVFLGLLFALPLTFIFNFIFVEIIFGSLGILISASVPWYAFIGSASSIIFIFIASFLLTWTKIKKQKLHQVIK